MPLIMMPNVNLPVSKFLIASNVLVIEPRLRKSPLKKLVSVLNFPLFLALFCPFFHSTFCSSLRRANFGWQSTEEFDYGKSLALTLEFYLTFRLSPFKIIRLRGGYC